MYTLGACHKKFFLPFLGFQTLVAILLSQELNNKKNLLISFESFITICSSS